VVLFLGVLAYLLWRRYHYDFSPLAHASRNAHRPLSANALKTAVEEAQRCGVASEFNAYITGIQCRLGSNNVQVGHLLWIFDQLEANLRYQQHMIIPQFTKH
jgi:hypothetical protein